VISDDNRFRLYEHATGGSELTESYATGTGPVSIVVADLNGDDRNDVAVAAYDGTVTFFLGKTGIDLSGDVNGSGSVNAIDVQLVINAALGLPVDCDCDVNGDGAVDALDVQLVTNAALGISTSQHNA
jgi:hypothetical protein